MTGERFDREESLGYLVNRAARLFARALERRLADHGVALGPFPILLLLWEEEGLTQTEIARRLDFEQPTIANTLKRMERDGLAVFAADPASKKRILAYPTDKARKLRPKLTAEASAVNAAAGATLSGQEVQQFKALLRKIAGNLEREGES